MARARKITGIDCHALARDAIGPVLITRLQEMCKRREKALKWKDPEGVHDMRVSSRRLRGALRDFEPYLNKRGLAAVTKQLKSVADALGDVRDQDVAIIGLQKLAAGAPDQAKATLGQFIQARDVIRKKARRNLRRALTRKTLKELQSSFDDAISIATAKSKAQKKRSKVEKTYVEIARFIINERLQELEKLSQGFYHPLNVKPLHKMRIAAKRLRYALELFEQCFGSGATAFSKQVARLQSSLGELHDSDIWIETFGAQLEASFRKAGEKTTGGSLWLLSHFVRLHAKHLRDALAQWEEWEKSKFSNQLREFLQRDVEDKPTS